VVPFPELKREADILQVLGDNGIPAPKIYGMCSDPVAIIMEAVPGTRNVAEAISDAQRRAVARQYIEALVRMHQLPLSVFADIGLDIPEGAGAIALAGVNAYLPLYLKNKSAPEPFIEFALRWLRRHVPVHRTRAGFMAFDAGQFLFEQGRITALYDFEFAMVGDPLTDLATMAMRDSYEPTGDSIGALCEYYAELRGEPLDLAVVRYHHAVFATVACMQFAGAIKNPKPGDPHDVYMEWDLALRKTLLNALGKNLQIPLPVPAPIAVPVGEQRALLTMLTDLVAQLSGTSAQQMAEQRAVARMAEYLQRYLACQPELDRLAILEAEPFVGPQPTLAAMETALELFVQNSGPEHEAELLGYFSHQLQRRVQVFSDISLGQSASHIQDDIFQ
jgi:aminoglycoside phosphotransferase (APT) family kinase protein